MSRSDGDKMLSDMAEGSADYDTDHDYEVDENGEEYDMSGDGSGRGELQRKFYYQLALTLSPPTGFEVGTPSFETNPPGTTTKEVNVGTTGAGFKLRISSSTLVLSSLIVILFKQF